MTTLETVKARIRKLQELANNPGTKGERQAAEAALNTLLKKYGITLEQAHEGIRSEREFLYKDNDQLSIISLVCSTVAEREITAYVEGDGRSRRKAYKKVWIDLTDSEYKEASYLIPQYLREYDEIRTATLVAFIVKNKLESYRPRKESSKLSDEDQRIIQKSSELSQGLQRANITHARHALEEG